MSNENLGSKSYFYSGKCHLISISLGISANQKVGQLYSKLIKRNQENKENVNGVYPAT